MALERVTKSEFKARALQYLRQVEESGVPVVVTDRGDPTVEIRRYRADPRSPQDLLCGTVIAYESPSAPVAEADWEAVS